MRPRIPWRKRLLVRLLFTSVLIALCSVAATAWLAVTTTTSALEEEQGQDLAADNKILAELSGYAADHPDWSGVQHTVRALAAKTGRRVALTTADRTLIADSAPHDTPLPPRPAAAVDPLHTDTYTEFGAQLSGIDPRAVGPFRLTGPEREKLDTVAKREQECLDHVGVRSTVQHTPSGRPHVVVDEATDAPLYIEAKCGEAFGESAAPASDALDFPTYTETKALTALTGLARPCLQAEDMDLGGKLSLTYDTTGRNPVSGGFLITKKDAGRSMDKIAKNCVLNARRIQLEPYVAPAAELFLGIGDQTAPRFDMSPANKARIVGAAGLVLAVTVAVTAVVAMRLVRPLRALPAAAQQPPELH
ncbi:two-component sensor histidine kinase, partial [Streptomyces sp. NPDC059627]